MLSMDWPCLQVQRGVVDDVLLPGACRERSGRRRPLVLGVQACKLARRDDCRGDAETDSGACASGITGQRGRWEAALMPRIFWSAVAGDWEEELKPFGHS